MTIHNSHYVHRPHHSILLIATTIYYHTIQCPVSRRSLTSNKDPRDAPLPIHLVLHLLLNPLKITMLLLEGIWLLSLIWRTMLPRDLPVSVQYPLYQNLCWLCIPQLPNRYVSLVRLMLLVNRQWMLLSLLWQSWILPRLHLNLIHTLLHQMPLLHRWLQQTTIIQIVVKIQLLTNTTREGRRLHTLPLLTPRIMYIYEIEYRSTLIL